jgi:hypothetical protein
MGENDKKKWLRHTFLSYIDLSKARLDGTIGLSAQCFLMEHGGI